MLRRRYFGALSFVAIVAGSARAETCNLVEGPQATESFRVAISMKLAGEMVVVQAGKAVTLKLAASAEHRYRERILAVQATDGLPSKSARVYDAAQATIAVDGAAGHRVLRPDRRLIVAQRQNDGLLCYSPAGRLTREELDTVSEHFDSLALGGLLPGKGAGVGDSWKLANTVVLSLCQFEALVSHDLSGKLVEVKDGMAAIAIDGSAKGIELGAQATIKVSATARFDVAKKRVVALEWKQNDARDQGPASPAINAETVVTLSREPIDEPKDLSDVALIGVPKGMEVPGSLAQLTVSDPKNRFELACGRDWQVTGQTDSHSILRLIDRGDFVAQAAISPWTKAEPGKHADIKEFRERMLASPGWQAEDVLQEGEMPNQSAGRYVWRVSAQGVMDGVKVVQTFYLIAGPGGDQAVVAVTYKQSQANKLGARDVVLIDGLEFPKK